MLITYREAQRITSLTRSTLERLVKAGGFPSPVPLTPGRLGFVREEVEDWTRRKVAAARGRSDRDPSPAHTA